MGREAGFQVGAYLACTGLLGWLDLGSKPRDAPWAEFLLKLSVLVFSIVKER